MANPGPKELIENVIKSLQEVANTYSSPAPSTAPLTSPQTNPRFHSQSPISTAASPFRAAFPAPSSAPLTSPQNIPRFQSQSSISTAAPPFRAAFPGLHGIRPGLSGLRQSVIPYRRQSGRASPAIVSWTHNFYCLGVTTDANTAGKDYAKLLENSGLAFKRIKFPDKNANHDAVIEVLCSNFPPLRSQEGAIMLWRCTVGGSYHRPLDRILSGPNGYSIQFLRETVRGGSTIYITPLNSDIIDFPSNSKTDTSTSQAEAKCSICNVKIPLSSFVEHLETCSKDQLLDDIRDTCRKNDGDTNNDDRMMYLVAMFPKESKERLSQLLDDHQNVDDVVDIILDCSIPATKNEKPMESFNEILNRFTGQKKSQTAMLNVNREELWRVGLTFYKKGYKDIPNLFKDFEVCFTSSTGEQESSDAGAIKLEFFELMMEQFDKRLMEGAQGQRVPRRADPLQFTLFGIFIGHCLLNGGPGYYSFQEWVFDAIIGKDDEEHLIQFTNKLDVPLNAASENVLKFVDELEGISDQNKLDSLIDENIHLVNCSQWDPTEEVTIQKKSLLSTELIYNEQIRKRLHIVKALRDGLKMIGLLGFMEDYPQFCKPVMVFVKEPLDANIIKKMLIEDDTEGFEQEQSLKFFKLYIDHNPGMMQKLFRFTTGLADVIPWRKSKIVIKFLRDDDEKIYPEAMACFEILYLPTVHSTFNAFEKHFSKALDIEGTGFSASF